MTDDSELELFPYRCLSSAVIDDPPTPLPETLIANLRRLLDSSPAVLEPSSITIDGFVIRERIGQGGMGSVYRAWDESLRRQVAIKVSDTAACEKTDAQFQREAHAAATVRSDFLVPIYSTGYLAGRRPYLVMPLIQGSTFRQRLKDGPLPPREIAEILLQVARGVQSLHSAGVLHRDIKPANILLDAVDGRAKLTDFGLARNTTVTALTLDGLFAGTPEYMAPEQAETGAMLDVLTDVYSLGITMFEGLTGRVPISGSPFDILRMRNTQEAISPRSLLPTVPRDLATICLKATERESSRRYGSAAEFAEDLERWIQGRPILARSTAWPERTARWSKRNPIAVTLMAVFVSGATAATIGWIQAVRNAALAEHRLIVSNEAVASESQQRERAEQHLATARYAIERFRGRITAPGFLAEPKYDGTRRELLSDAAEAYQRLLEIELNDERLQIDAIGTANSLGFLQSQLGQLKEAEATLQRSIKLARSHAASNPADPEALALLGLSLNTLHVILVKEECYLQASEVDLESIEIARKLLALKPEDQMLRRNLVALNANSANAFLAQGNTEEAARRIRDAIVQIDELLRVSPDDYVLLADRARLNFNLGYTSADETKRSALWQDALEQRRTLLKREKRHFVVLEFIKNCTHLAIHLVNLGDAENAVKIAQDGINEALVVRMKQNDFAIKRLQAQLSNALAIAQAKLHRKTEANRAFRDALQLHTELCNSNLQQNWANAIECIIDFNRWYADQGEGQSEAAKALRASAQVWLDSLRKDPNTSKNTLQMIDEKQRALENLK